MTGIQFGIILIFFRLFFDSFSERQDLKQITTGDFEINWVFSSGYLFFSSPVIHGDLVYAGGSDSILHAINLKNGEKVSSFETESYRENRLKYFKDDDSYRDDIYSIIKSNEQFLDVECELGGIFSTPAISDGKIILTSTNGKIYCISNRSF
jgi:outer membrane protein assembly factor BamB